MRELVLQMGISIDGYVSGGPEQDIGAGEAEHADVAARKLAWVTQAGVHAMGRVTYEEMSGFWPTSTSEYAQPMNEIPKVVFSRTLTRADRPSTTIAGGKLEEEVAKLKAEVGGDIIVYGGYTLAQALTRANLVDEYRLVTRPVALGSGEPMFKNLPEGRRLTRAGPGHSVPRRHRHLDLPPAKLRPVVAPSPHVAEPDLAGAAMVAGLPANEADAAIQQPVQSGAPRTVDKCALSSLDVVRGEEWHVHLYTSIAAGDTARRGSRALIGDSRNDVPTLRRATRPGLWQTPSRRTGERPTKNSGANVAQARSGSRQ